MRINNDWLAGILWGATITVVGYAVFTLGLALDWWTV